MNFAEAIEQIEERQERIIDLLGIIIDRIAENEDDREFLDGILKNEADK